MIEAYIGNIHSRIIVRHILVGPVTAHKNIHGICGAKADQTQTPESTTWGTGRGGAPMKPLLWGFIDVDGF